MAHNVETMFYTRTKPWHSLGYDVQEALTSKEAIIAAGLDWEVKSRAVYVDNIKVPNYKANVRTNAKKIDQYGNQQYENGEIMYHDDSVLGIVSDRYRIVQNLDAFNFTDSLIGDDVKYETAGSLQNGKLIWLLAQLPEQKILDDAIAPYLCFTNSHDGSSAVKVCITPVRVVCNNTLNLALKNCTRSFSAKHTVNINGRLEEAQQALKLANTYMSELDTTANIMVNKTFSDSEFKDFLDEMFMPKKEEISDRQQDGVDYLIDGVKTAYMADDIKKFHGTKWAVINAMSDFVYHSSPLRETANYKENLWRKSLDGNPILDKAMKLLAA